MAERTKEARAKAELRFRKAEQATTSRNQAMAEYTAEAEKRRVKTLKLKELRLAKEAEDLATAEAAEPKKKPARKAKKA